MRLKPSDAASTFIFLKINDRNFNSVITEVMNANRGASKSFTQTLVVRDQTVMRLRDLILIWKILL